MNPSRFLTFVVLAAAAGCAEPVPVRPVWSPEGT